MSSLELAQLIQHFFDEKKAEDIVILDLHTKGFIVDYMVIATASSNRQVHALADYVYQELKARDLYVKVEGAPQSDWFLIDAGDVIAHIFKSEARSFYNLEKMWGDHSPTLSKVSTRS